MTKASLQARARTDSAQTAPETPPASQTLEAVTAQSTALATVPKLDAALGSSLRQLLDLQKTDGHWVFDLEADATIPSEYIFLQRFLGREMDADKKAKFRAYIKARQMPDGGWPLYTGGTADLSCSVKAYFALKMLGDSPDLPHMQHARKKVLEMGGAENSNVFTRITLALFGQIPWRLAPAMPIEITMLPDWFFFHLRKVSYWSRTVIVPLLILYARQPICHLSEQESIGELFCSCPVDLKHVDCFRRGVRKNAFILLDRTLKRCQSIFPVGLREKAIRRAENWTRERMGEGGIGAIFPAMANAVMALKVLGYPDTDPDVARGIQAIDDLLVDRGNELLCQPCVSPIWDSCLSLSTVMESGLTSDDESVQACVDWLFEKQIFAWGDWNLNAPDLEPGGWAFQYENTFYPDVDDTAMVLMALLRAGAQDKPEYRERMSAAINWTLGLQSSDGGWGAFDIDNNYLYLNDIPFADHGALLDPPTSDLTGRVLELLGMLGYDTSFPPAARGLEFLKREQEADGSWFGRWGVNYIYGTWSVLMGLRQIGEDMNAPYIQKAASWLKSRQNPDGGWGETCFTYNEPKLGGKGVSTPSQTAWALLGLLAADQVDSKTVKRGIAYLTVTMNDDGTWDEQEYTGTGFPKVFYLLYHGYSQYFPTWAMGVYKRLSQGQPMREEEIRLTPGTIKLNPRFCA